MYNKRYLHMRECDTDEYKLSHTGIYCECCFEEILPGEKYIDDGYTKLCAGCVDYDLSADQLLDWLGYSEADKQEVFGDEYEDIEYMSTFDVLEKLDLTYHVGECLL